MKPPAPGLIQLILSGIFLTSAIVAELIGGKLITIGPFVMSIGVIPWPVVFITTDLLNEFYGKAIVRQLTLVTVGMIIFTFLILQIVLQIPAAGFSPVGDLEFSKVFGQSSWIIVGSIIAFLCSQYIDIYVFSFFRKITGGKMIWLRATGSTAVSQMIDTILILGIAFWLPGKLNGEEFINLSFTNYSYKFLIAIGLTPLIYSGHYFMKKYLV